MGPGGTWARVDMEFLFECSTRYFTGERSERVRYRVEHEKRNSIFSFYFHCCKALLISTMKICAI